MPLPPLPARYCRNWPSASACSVVRQPARVEMVPLRFSRISATVHSVINDCAARFARRPESWPSASLRNKRTTRLCPPKSKRPDGRQPSGAFLILVPRARVMPAINPSSLFRLLALLLAAVFSSMASETTAVAHPMRHDTPLDRSCRAQALKHIPHHYAPGKPPGPLDDVNAPVRRAFYHHCVNTGNRHTAGSR
jgi:hypothetical protein